MKDNDEFMSDLIAQLSDDELDILVTSLEESSEEDERE